MSIDSFKITQRHYNTIIKQSLDNAPQECGGFLGGSNGVIQAIQPLFNMHLYNKTDTFSFTQEDVYRAHKFFEKHNLTYYGLYHSHPKGAPEPSQTDIDTGHKYHFIVGVRDPKKPVMNAFEIRNKHVIPLPLTVVSDKHFSSKDLQSKKKGSSKNMGDQDPMLNDVKDLDQKLDKMVQDKKIKYPKLDPKQPYDSDFSTLA